MIKGSAENEEKLRLWTRLFWRILAILVAIVAAATFVYLLRTVILMLVLSVFFSYLIAPLVRICEQPVYIAGRELKIPRSIAVAVVYVLLGAALFVAVSSLWPILWTQITQLGQHLPEYISGGTSTLRKTFSDADSWLRHVRIPREWRETIIASSSDAAERLLPWLQDSLLRVLAYLQYLPWLIIVPIVSFFMLKDASVFERAIITLVPSERLQKRLHWLLLDVSRTIAAYIRAQITACVEVGAVVTIVLWLGGVPYAVVLGLISGVAEFVPMIGPLFAAVVAITLTLTTSFKMAVIVALFLAGLRIAQDYIIYPRIVGHGIRMHPLIVILAILGGAEIGGLIGIFLAIPFVGLAIVIYNHYLAYRGIQSLALQSAPADAPSDAKSEPVAGPALSPPDVSTPAV